MKIKRLNAVILLVMLVMCASIALYGCKKSAGTDEGNGYTVTFETYGGTEFYPVVTASGGQPITLSAPKKAGYEFLGWYDNEQFEGEALGEEYSPDGDVTLYAKWSEIAYTVSFETYGGTEYYPVVSNGTPVNLPAPEREGYEFGGWFLNEEFSGEELSVSFSPSTDVTLYAKWTAAFYEVEFETFGGTEYDAVKVSKTETIELPTPQKYSYDFLGWYDNKSFEGEPLSATYLPTANTTLYAKWDEVVYVYLYYGESTDFTRLSCHSGDVITVAELDEPAPLVVRGAQCPFVKWCYDGLALVDADEVITVADEEIYLVAVYDMSNIPPLERIEADENGNLVTTGSVVKVLEDNGENEGRFSIDVSVIKTSETSGVGSAEVAFRIIHSGADYAGQTEGMYYLMAGVSPGGYVEIHRVTNGTWSRIKRFELIDTPAVWQEKYNSAMVGDKVTVRMTVCDYGDKFDIYLDNVLLYTYSDASVLNLFTGTGFGLRSNTKAGTVFANWQYNEFTTVSFETNGGTAVEQIKYGMGALNVEEPTKENYVFEGWYYDEALTEAVDMANPVISGTAVTLYAKWREADVTVTLMSEGSVYDTITYSKGTAINLPIVTPVAANRIFTGWYYDEAHENAVNADELEVSGTTLTLYAGFRYPTTSALTDNGDGTYSLIAQSGVAVIGETQYPATRYDMNLSLQKSNKGATGIAFRQEVRADNTYNNSKYIGVTIYSTGIMQVALCPGNNQVVHLTGIICTGAQQLSTIGLAKLPSAWQTKYGNAATGETIGVMLTIVDYGETFEVYLDGDFAFRYVNLDGTSDDIDGYTGTGYGIRHTSQTATFTLATSALTTVSFETNGGTAVEQIKYGMGALNVEEPTKENYVFEGWYYDEALSEAVDMANPVISGTAVTLYAKWEEA